MNFLPGLLALILCCFLYSSLTTCQPLESISEDELNRQLQKIPFSMYKGYLYYAIPAASVGKNLFKIPQSVSEDCTRTAKLITQAFFEPSKSAFFALPVIEQSINETMKHVTGSTFHDQVEMVCHNLDKEAKARPLVFGDFEESKKSVQVPKPAKDYIAEIPANQTLTQWDRTTPMPLDEPQMFKFQVVMMMRHFRNLSYPSENLREPAVIARTINLVASRKTLDKEFFLELDKVFMDTLDDFVKNLPTPPDDIKQSRNISFYVSEFLKKVDQNLLNNNVVKEEYGRMKTAASDQLKPKSPK